MSSSDDVPTTQNVSGDFDPSQVTDTGASEPVGQVGEQELDGIDKSNIVEGGDRAAKPSNPGASENALDSAIDSAS